MPSAPASPRSLHGVRTQLGIGVPMRDGVKLSTDLYQPDAPGPFPVILIRTPYCNNVAAGVEDAVYFAQRGYAVAIQDVRGRFDSEGDWAPFVHEAQDGYDAQEWCGTQPWSPGRSARAGRPTSRSPSGWRRRSATGTSRPWRPASGSRTSITTGSTPAAPSSSGSISGGARCRCTRGRPGSSLWMPPEHTTRRCSGTCRLHGRRRAGRLNEFYREWIRHPDYGPYWERLGNVEKDYARDRRPGVQVRGLVRREPAGHPDQPHRRKALRTRPSARAATRSGRSVDPLLANGARRAGRASISGRRDDRLGREVSAGSTTGTEASTTGS